MYMHDVIFVFVGRSIQRIAVAGLLRGEECYCGAVRAIEVTFHKKVQLQLSPFFPNLFSEHVSKKPTTCAILTVVLVKSEALHPVCQQSDK